MKNKLIILLSSIIFSMGLSISGMTDTEKVLGFLNIRGNWDVSLMIVMAVALAVVIPAFYYISSLAKPLLSDKFSLPSLKHIDQKLVIGSLLFGLGWGLYGYCPGPALSSLVYFHFDTYIFVASMLLGMFGASKLQKTQILINDIAE